VAIAGAVAAVVTMAPVVATSAAAVTVGPTVTVSISNVPLVRVSIALTLMVVAAFNL
jgi:hypothetical protein